MSAAPNIKEELSARERLAELKAKGKLSLREAAEYLTLVGTKMSSRTLYNRISMARNGWRDRPKPGAKEGRFHDPNPSMAPRRTLNASGDWVFLVEDLEAWNRLHSEVHEAHVK
jgi:hypothetical protein